ncbi:MAG TPA: UDP-N-acetylglucosamine 2-epimerase (non-hydrolyzing) [Candidatus Binatia bacterium]|nr:UDP-N-acetylglucosamine 2-epimerase (non-hydrolyzing) [Candidatus Binatia bacterium]
MSVKVLLVAGARPNYMKIAPLWWAMRERGDARFTPVLVHTGQHYDDSMSAAFFRDLGLPEPGINLGVGSGSHAAQTARVMVGFEQVLQTERPDVVVIVGDVNSTAACALVTSKIDLGSNGRPVRPVLAHVEAGLRSRDRDMPEEVNRVVADALSDVLFTTCRDAADNLTREGLPPERIRFVGNPMIDSLRRCLSAAERCGFLERLGLGERGFGLCTLHRPSNVDHPDVLERLLDALAEIAANVPVLLPLHPRTRDRITRFGLEERVASLARPERGVPGRGLVGIEPMSYLEMLEAMRSSAFVLTDSGGIQEETTALGVPCVTLRENTERPVTVSEGTNVLAGRDAISDALERARRKATASARVPELWDGRAGERIVAALVEMSP